MEPRTTRTQEILRQLLARLAEARSLTEVNVSAGIALNQLEGKDED